MTCPRCGRPQPPSAHPGATRYCVHCGRALGGVRWVAHTPDALRPRTPSPAPSRYAGPPSYRDIPRWSLWPWAAPAPPGSPDGPPEPPPPRDPDAALRASAGLLTRLCVTTAVLAGITAVAEGWRYALLLASRTETLSPGPLGFSDTLVTLFGLLTPVAALATGVVFLGWLLRARDRAAELSGTRPSRPRWVVVVGSIVPGPNLTIPGSACCEVEHAAAGRPPSERPRPSRPVAVWWALWAASVVAGIAALVRGLGDGVQAMADAVVLHAAADVLAAAAAVATVAVVRHLTALLAPELRAAGRSWVVRVASATRAAA